MTTLKTYVNQVILSSNDYHISGNMVNGGRYDENGDWTPFVHYAEYTRQIISIDFEKGLLNCICGRQFLIDDNLNLYECHY